MFRRILELAFRYRLPFLLSMPTCFGAVLANLVMPKMIGQAADQVIAIERHRGEGVAARGLLQMLAVYFADMVDQSVRRDLRCSLFQKPPILDFAFHDRIHSGDLITRGMLDLEGVGGFVEIGLLRILQVTLPTTIGGFTLFQADPVLAAASLAIIPVVGLLAGRMGIRLRLAWTQLQQRLGILTRVMEEILQGVRVVRAFPARDHQMAAFDAASIAAIAHADRRILIQAHSLAEIEGLYHCAMLAILWLGSMWVASGAIMVGHLQRPSPSWRYCRCR